jgi:hypothetical protein
MSTSDVDNLEANKSGCHPQGVSPAESKVVIEGELRFLPGGQSAIVNQDCDDFFEDWLAEQVGGNRINGSGPHKVRITIEVLR